jgi:DNA polymerase elongation subunit (family B)
MSHYDRVALDIETIATVDNPDFNDPTHWIPFAVALGYCGCRGNPKVDVLFRRDATLDAEAELLHRTVDWIAARSGSNRDILTFNGESYDFPILQHRATAISESKPQGSLDERLSLLRSTSTHVDLLDTLRDDRGYRMSLDDALDEYEVEVDANPTWNGEKVTGAHMPDMGLEILSDRDTRELRDVVRRYAASDVRPLFALDDRLRAVADAE